MFISRKPYILRMIYILSEYVNRIKSRLIKIRSLLDMILHIKIVAVYYVCVWEIDVTKIFCVEREKKTAT